MEKKELLIAYTEWESINDLPEHDALLLKEARAQTVHAYAPYSRFRVGAVARMESGDIVRGSNQENASYPNGLCAERTAIFYAGAQFPNVKIKKMAISARSLTHSMVTPVPPCGACRQVIAEYELKQEEPIDIYFMGESGKVVRSASLKNILPLIFDSSYL